jgi:hypothetical protein
MIPLRHRSFATLKGKEYPMSTDDTFLVSRSVEDTKSGFIRESDFEGGWIYCLPITPDKVESAYHVETWCALDGFDLQIMNIVNGYYCLLVDQTNKKMMEHFGVISTPEPLSFIIERTEGQLTYIWEVHKAIKDFPFKGPDWVILKFDGKWLE